MKGIGAQLTLFLEVLKRKKHPCRPKYQRLRLGLSQSQIGTILKGWEDPKSIVPIVDDVFEGYDWDVLRGGVPAGGFYPWLGLYDLVSF